jgi:hypothetical protein
MRRGTIGGFRDALNEADIAYLEEIFSFAAGAGTKPTPG